MNGRITRLLVDKGFGFIQDAEGTEYFFHRSAVEGADFRLLAEGQTVIFDPEEGQKGPRAANVKVQG